MIQFFISGIGFKWPEKLLMILNCYRYIYIDICQKQFCIVVDTSRYVRYALRKTEPLYEVYGYWFYRFYYDMFA